MSGNTKTKNERLGEISLYGMFSPKPLLPGRWTPEALKKLEESSLYGMFSPKPLMPGWPEIGDSYFESMVNPKDSIYACEFIIGKLLSMKPKSITSKIILAITKWGEYPIIGDKKRWKEEWDELGHREDEWIEMLQELYRKYPPKYKLSKLE